MKEPVTILIPVFEKTLTAVAMNSLASVHTHLSDFPITFIKGESFTETQELTDFCPKADFVSFDDRYFSSRTGYAKLLLGDELYYNFGWSRYLLVCEMNTVITRNELAYWCRQGYDFIQPWPDFMANQSAAINVHKRFKTQNFIRDNKENLSHFAQECGISLRNIEAFQKLIKSKKRSVSRFLSSTEPIENDAIFWELFANRLWPDLNTPTSLSRNRFAQYGIQPADFAKASESPFAITGLTRPLPAPDNL